MIKNGYRYLGSFIGGKEVKIEWLVLKIEDRIEAVEQVAEMAKFVPQTTYVGMQRALQQEWNLYRG